MHTPYLPHVLLADKVHEIYQEEFGNVHKVNGIVYVGTQDVCEAGNVVVELKKFR